MFCRSCPVLLKAPSTIPDSPLMQGTPLHMKVRAVARNWDDLKTTLRKKE